MQFHWIDWNRDHIAEHGVAKEEAEMVVRNARAPFPEEIEDEIRTGQRSSSMPGL